MAIGPHSSHEPLLEALKPIIGETFGADVVTAGSIPLLLDSLARRKRADWSRLLGIADADLYTSNLNFVFGEADAYRAVAVFSIARLHTADRERFIHRAATEAIHELGHTYGLRHCRDTRCVMWFSNTLKKVIGRGHGSARLTAMSCSGLSADRATRESSAIVHSRSNPTLTQHQKDVALHPVPAAESDSSAAGQATDRAVGTDLEKDEAQALAQAAVAAVEEGVP
jgi:hypothetical protein